MVVQSHVIVKWLGILSIYVFCKSHNYLNSTDTQPDVPWRGIDAISAGLCH